MKPFIRAICRYVADRTSLTFGNGDSADLRVGELPRDLDGVYAIDAPTIEPDKETPIIYSTIDFWARYKNTETAYAKLNEIYDVLDRMYEYFPNNGTSESSFEVYFSHALGQIEDNDRDAEGGKLLKLSVIFIYRNVDTIS